MSAGDADPAGAVLAVDSASPVVGAALRRADGSDEHWQARVVRGADAKLVPAVAELVKAADRAGVELGRVTVTVGPGAFTGLRVGVATALGVAVARGLVVQPLSSLRVRAAQVWDEPRVLALLDARKGRVYAGLFDCRGASNGQAPQPLGPERDAPLADVLPTAPFVAVGEGARVHAEAIAAAGGRVIDRPVRTAAQAAAWLATCPGLPAAMDAAEVSLRYLRAPDATPPSNLGRRVGSA